MSNYPNLLEVQLTSNCNLHCIYCGNSPGLRSNNILDVDKVLSAIDQLKPKRILFTGGEVFIVWNQLIKILDQLKNSSYEYILSSNLTLIQPSHIDTLIDFYGFSTFHTSFNDLDISMTQKIRGGHQDTRERLIENIKHILKRGKTLKVETILLNQNINQLPDINHYLTRLGVRHHKVEFLIPVGYAQTDLLVPTNKIINTLLKTYYNKQKGSSLELTCFYLSPCMDDSRKVFAINDKELIFNKCIDGKESCYLLANGKLLPCFIFPDEDMDVHVDNLDLLHQWRTHPAFVGSRLSPNECISCASYYHNSMTGTKQCNNGCLVLNYLHNKKFNNTTITIA